MPNIINEDTVIRMSPGDVSNSTRPRKPAPGTSSIYVPPPLRKRKNSNDIAKNSVNQPQKTKLVSGRGISIGPSPSVSCSNHKKCENSYMIFGLEDKSSISSLKNPDKVNYSNKSSDQENKDSSSHIKKCDNSYLLFMSDNGAEKSDSSYCSNRNSNELSRKQNFSSRVDLNDSSKKKTPNSMDDNHFSNYWSNTTESDKTLENSVGLGLPEDLSSELDSLSVGNKYSKPVEIHSRDSSKYLKQSSQKKCDNSSILFDYDCSDNNRNQNDTSQPLASRHDNSYVPSQSFGDAMISNNVTVDKENKLNDAEKTLDGTVNSSIEISDSIEDYVIEIYDFPKTMRTQDLMSIFSSYTQDGFVIKWIDDTHALGIFSNPFSVSDVLKKKHDLVSVRSLSNAIAASIEIASTIPIPSASRPRTCPSLARRLVSGALGLKVLVSDEIRQAEKKMLQDAKEERRLAARQREEAWEGTLRSNLGS